MSLHSKEWFYKQCLNEAHNKTALAALSWDVLFKGIGQEDSTRSHVNQPIGAVQQFLAQFPHHVATIRAAPSNQPFNLPAHPLLLRDWVSWVKNRQLALVPKSGDYGRSSFGYNINTLRRSLPVNLGGTRRGGGGSGDEFKKVLRLLPEFIGRP